MANWTRKKVPITIARDDIEEREGVVRGQGSVKLEDCPFRQEIEDDTGRVRRVECADDSTVKPCEPGLEGCKLQQWVESVKAFIRGIDVNSL
jgi:hypothetical protein